MFAKGGKCMALLRFVSETFRHEAAAYECIQIARTPKDPRAETQIQNYFWVLVRVNLQQTGPGALILESLQGVGWTRGGNGKVVDPTAVCGVGLPWPHG